MQQDFRGIRTGSVPAPSQRPIIGTVPPEKRWTFSMLYWRQRDFFGLGTCDRHWFISFLNRLTEISKIPLDEFMNEYRIRDNHRYHAINWQNENIPIRISDLDWLGDQINAEDFELVQFQVSTGTGRIIGFFDHNSVFNIVLLDPMHNMQPSTRFGYRVQATHIAECQFSKLTSRFQNIVTSSKYLNQDQKNNILGEIHDNYSEFTGGCIMVNISNEYLEKIHAFAASGLIANAGELVEFAIDELKKAD